MANAFGDYTPGVLSQTSNAVWQVILLWVLRILELVLGRRWPFWRAVILLVLAIVLALVVRVPMPEIPVLPLL